MKIKRYFGVLLALILLSACGNESLRDTYKDYAGTGEIRYIGRCTDLLVKPGWKRLIVTWENNVDPIIKKVKIKWKLDAEQDSILLERGTKSYSIELMNGEILDDGNYEISVSGVDVDGNASIANSVFGRPYTFEHEEVIAFNRLISKTYVIRDRLILYFLGWQDNMKKATLNYTKKDGSSAVLELNKELVDELYYMLPDAIDPSKPIILNRTGELPECADVIEFNPYEFSYDKVYEADFKQEMKRQFGYDEIIPDNWANSVETIYLDWGISSFSDLLNLPNLKKLILGSRRYLLPEAIDDETYGQSKVAEKSSSDFALKVLNELNGLTVERYNKHFQNITKTDFIEDKGNTNVEPSVIFMDLSGLTFTVYPEDDEFWPSGLEYLTDGNFTTYWDPLYLQMYTTYELTLDLKSPKKINGLRFVQKQYTRMGEIAIAPELIKIKVSNDMIRWIDATHVEENTVGKSNGEINYIPFDPATTENQYRYVQVHINAGSYGGYYYSSAAEISLY